MVNREDQEVPFDLEVDWHISALRIDRDWLWDRAQQLAVLEDFGTPSAVGPKHRALWHADLKAQGLGAVL
jgi:hypothetical protein